MSDPRKPHPRAVARRAHNHGGDDAVVVEEPLEIQVGGETLAITMRTPGNDEYLAAGFLYAEGRVRNKGDILRVCYVDPTDEVAGCNTMDVTLADGVANLEPKQAVKRGTISTAACGVCGRQTIADLLEVCSPQRIEPTVAASVLVRLTEDLAARQPVFDETGGCHAAAIVAADGNVLASHEDVGRHNAVDKAVGELVFDGVLDRAAPANGAGSPACLVVSGRVSFEIVQKAAVAAIPVVASVSAASSLAIDLAREMGIALVAFARDGRYTVYSHPQRITT